MVSFCFERVLLHTSVHGVRLQKHFKVLSTAPRLHGNPSWPSARAWIQTMSHRCLLTVKTTATAICPNPFSKWQTADLSPNSESAVRPLNCYCVLSLILTIWHMLGTECTHHGKESCGK